MASNLIISVMNGLCIKWVAYYNVAGCIAVKTGERRVMKRSLICLLLLVSSAGAQAEPNIALLASTCAACHGTNGHSVGEMPALAGLEQAYFIQQMQDFASGER